MNSPCRYPLCPALADDSGYCAGHKKLRYQPGNVDPFYKTAQWRAVRKLALQRQPLCESCLVSGIRVRATEVDHIQPITSGGARLDLNNLQSLCKPCHSRKTSKERVNFMPRYDTEIILVCGPPASGKTTYVKQHMTYGDMVIDLDAIVAALSGQPLYDKPHAIVAVAINTRAALLNAAIGLVPRVWVICGGATKEQREQACPNPTQTIMLTTPRHTCKARVQERTDPAGWCRLIDEWWDTTDIGQTGKGC